MERGGHDDVTSRSVSGCLVGTAVGDALGLPYEGLSPRRANKLLGEPDRYRFVFGRGMVSDDTEHAVMVAESLVFSSSDRSSFGPRLASHLKFWLAAVPGGVGFGTLRSIVKLWVGFSPDRSGVFSAGNGPAMRASLLGLAAHGLEELRELVQVSTCLTHTDPKASHGAMAIALAARLASRGEVAPEAFLEELTKLVDDDGAELLGLVASVVESVGRGEATERFASNQGHSEGVSGYIYHTVPVCLHAWFSHPADFAGSVGSVIRCGGDADTTAAIVGGIVGARVGPEGIPEHYKQGIRDWPLSVRRLERLGAGMVDTSVDPAFPPYRWVLRLPRNLFFVLVVLAHGLRRALPPY